jgi:hypothetical protein
LQYADRIYGFQPQADGTVKVELRHSRAVEEDGAAMPGGAT